MCKTEYVKHSSLAQFCAVFGPYYGVGSGTCMHQWETASQKNVIRRYHHTVAAATVHMCALMCGGGGR